uniref:Uncharacterized protein n=1 Tax=Setaria viridis TaxID=4556 RepID=A0A4V6DBA8_SETVI|nr:hypothetical protein SEVIR_2G168500v2 [Setaria viridis]
MRSGRRRRRRRRGNREGNPSSGFLVRRPRPPGPAVILLRQALSARPCLLHRMTDREGRPRLRMRTGGDDDVHARTPAAGWAWRPRRWRAVATKGASANPKCAARRNVAVAAAARGSLLPAPSCCWNGRRERRWPRGSEAD